MKFLFIHQNFPAQFYRLAQHLAQDPQNEIIGIGERCRVQARGVLPNITTLCYESAKEVTTQGGHPYLATLDVMVRRGLTVARILLLLQEKGYKPDVIGVHPGWGEGMFIRNVFPKVPLLVLCEYFFSPTGGSVGFDPEFKESPDFMFGVELRNTAQVATILHATVGLAPTAWQRSRYPKPLKQHIQVIHEGIDTAYMCPDPSAVLVLQPQATPGESTLVADVQDLDPAVVQEVYQGVPQPENGGAQSAESLPPPLRLGKKDKIITYLARNLEPYRGFHTFLRALPAVQRLHPDAHIVIVGGTDISYSYALPNGELYKDRYLKEVGAQLDLSHIHFLGRIPYPALKRLFNISSAHIYLTYPFVLSWSVLEAMSCEALVIGSRTAPVEEVITDGENGVLVDFFDKDALVEKIDYALSKPQDFYQIRKQARVSVLQKYRLEDCLQQRIALLQAMGRGEYSLEE